MEMAKEKFAMKKRLGVTLCILVLFLIFTSSAFASSSYVLPYPSSMPGSFMYNPRLLLEKALKFWYFGNFGQFTYNLKQSDKYLVEAKTLFEYNQYLLAYKALQKSDSYFLKTLPNLKDAQKEGKNISQNRKLLSSAAQKHIEILQNINLPDEFVWQPEKSASSVLQLKSAIETSISIRKKYQ